MKYHYFDYPKLEKWLTENQFPSIDDYAELQRTNTLVIDLDNTLIWPQKNNNNLFYCRRHTRKFLLQMKQCYKQLILYTAGADSHARNLAGMLSKHCGISPTMFDQVISGEMFRKTRKIFEPKDLRFCHDVDSKSYSDVLLIDDRFYNPHPDQLNNFLHIPDVCKDNPGNDDVFETMSGLLVHLSQCINIPHEIERLNKIWLAEGILRIYEFDPINRIEA